METDWVMHCSPSLVSHAPRLSHAALLPHFDHACEGLHTRLPLGDQRDLSLHTHVGPGREKVIKNEYSPCRKHTVMLLRMHTSAIQKQGCLQHCHACDGVTCPEVWGLFVMSGFWYLFLF